MRRASGTAARLAMMLLVLGIGLPLGFTLLASLRPEASLFAARGLGLGELTLEHYRALLRERSFWVPLANSLVVAGATTALCVPLGALCAYALARLRFWGKGPILGLFLATSMFPQISIVSPLYLVLRTLGLIDHYAGLVLPYVTFAMPLAVWLLVGFFRQLPPELEEAAMLDGATRLGALVRIVLPLVLPGLATTAIVTFVYCWNEFLFALSFTTLPSRQTVPVAIALMRGQHQVPWGEVLAAAMLATLPVAAVVLAWQRRIVAGLTAGAVKQ